MRADWVLIEYWSEVLRQNRHFYVCSKCSYVLKHSDTVCPNCGSEMSDKVILPQRRMFK